MVGMSAIMTRRRELANLVRTTVQRCKLDWPKGQILSSRQINVAQHEIDPVLP